MARIKNPGFEDAYQSLLLEYAAGSLNEAMSLIVSAHMALSHEACRHVSEYEELGGMILYEFCEPAALSDNAIDRVWERIEHSGPDYSTDDYSSPPSLFNNEESALFPECLQQYLSKDCGKWKKACPGMHKIRLKMHCREMETSLLRYDKNAPLGNAASLNMYDIMLVLDGTIQDQNSVYYRGDLMFSALSTPQARPDTQKGCLCLSAKTSTPSWLSRFIEKLR